MSISPPTSPEQLKSVLQSVTGQSSRVRKPLEGEIEADLETQAKRFEKGIDTDPVYFDYSRPYLDADCIFVGNM